MKTEKLSYKNLIIFSIPSILQGLIEPLASLVDTSILGRLSTEYLAALAISSAILTSSTWIFNFLIHATTSRVSTAVGENNKEKVKERIRISLFISLIIGISVSILIFLFKGQILTLMGTNDELKLKIIPYLEIRLIGLPFILVTLAGSGVLRGLGKVSSSFLIGLVITIINIILTVILVYHYKLGLIGASVGTSISFFIGFLLSIIIITKKEKNIFKSLKITSIEFLNFSSDSFNIFIRSFFLLSSIFISTSIVSRIGENQLAAHQIALQLWVLASFIMDGLAITANIYGAKLLGENKKEELQNLFRRILTIGAILGGIFFIIFCCFKNNIYELFSHDRNIFFQMDLIWPILTIGQLINSFTFIYDGVFFGLSEYKFLRKTMIYGVLLFFLPISLISLSNQNFLGVWIALLILNTFRTLSCWTKLKSSIYPKLVKND